MQGMTSRRIRRCSTFPESFLKNCRLRSIERCCLSHPLIRTRMSFPHELRCPGCTQPLTGGARITKHRHIPPDRRVVPECASRDIKPPGGVFDLVIPASLLLVGF